MSTDSELVPVFLPPLATMLADAENQKGKPLTEKEVERLRDKAVCVQMDAADAEQMADRRGYIDVNPENCWSDWHRLRVQLTGNGFLPKIILCLLGDEDFPDDCKPILKKEKIEHEFRARDERMVDAFQASASPLHPPFKHAELERIREHETVLYVLSENYPAQDALKVSADYLRLGARLLKAGGIALKCESAGVSHARARWFDLASAVDSKEGPWFALFDAYVQLPLQSEENLYSCGMHLLGEPDLIVTNDVLNRASGDVVELFQQFGLYLLADCGVGKFGSGHTFSVAKEAPRYRVVWEPCTGYDEEDFFFNPFGRWRFTNA